jgi:hypothetical protein
MTNPKTEQLNLRMSPKAKALLRAAAIREHRSASNMVEHLVLDYCDKNAIAELDTEANLTKTKNENR